MIQIHPKEFERYLRWRINEKATGLDMAANQIFRIFGTNPIIVSDDGQLSSPGHFVGSGNEANPR